MAEKDLTPPSRIKPFLIAALVAMAGAFCAIWLDPGLTVIVAANGFFATYVALSLGRIRHLNQDYLKRFAASSDAPAFLIFMITVGAVATSLAALFVVINAPSGTGGAGLLLALVAVPLGWATVHLMSAIHYAHLFWQPEPGEGTPRKGLEFPGTKAPEGWDFVYFAFVIGMTAQTSDVQITSQHMRRFNLTHGIVSFFFNTVLVAAAVNLAVSLKG